MPTENISNCVFCVILYCQKSFRKFLIETQRTYYIAFKTLPPPTLYIQSESYIVKVLVCNVSVFQYFSISIFQYFDISVLPWLGNLHALPHQLHLDDPHCRHLAHTLPCHLEVHQDQLLQETFPLLKVYHDQVPLKSCHTLHGSKMQDGPCLRIR